MTATASISFDDDEEEEINDGFSGPVMGGSKHTHSDFRAASNPPVRKVSNNPFD